MADDQTEQFLAAQLARPLTHRVTTTFADGRTICHDVRSLGAAENYATGERRKIGRCLLSRDTGGTVPSRSDARWPAQ